MSEEKGRLEDLMDSVRQMRDELALQIHLGGKEAKEEWDRLEKKWEELKRDAQPYTDAVGETARNVGTAAELAAGELHKGYKKIRDLLTS